MALSPPPLVWTRVIHLLWCGTCSLWHCGIWRGWGGKAGRCVGTDVVRMPRWLWWLTTATVATAPSHMWQCGGVVGLCCVCVCHLCIEKVLDGCKLIVAVCMFASSMLFHVVLCRSCVVLFVVCCVCRASSQRIRHVFASKSIPFRSFCFSHCSLIVILH